MSHSNNSDKISRIPRPSPSTYNKTQAQNSRASAADSQIQTLQQRLQQKDNEIQGLKGRMELMEADAEVHKSERYMVAAVQAANKKHQDTLNHSIKDITRGKNLIRELEQNAEEAEEREARSEQELIELQLQLRQQNDWIKNANGWEEREKAFHEKIEQLKFELRDAKAAKEAAESSDPESKNVLVGNPLSPNPQKGFEIRRKPLATPSVPSSPNPSPMVVNVHVNVSASDPASTGIFNRFYKSVTRLHKYDPAHFRSTIDWSGPPQAIQQVKNGYNSYLEKLKHNDDVHERMKREIVRCRHELKECETKSVQHKAVVHRLKADVAGLLSEKEALQTRISINDAVMEQVRRDTHFSG